MLQTKLFPLRKNLLSYCCRQLASTSGELGPIGKKIKQKLENALSPSVLRIECESDMHKGPRGQERHFYVNVVSAKFENLSLVKRHRLVNTVLSDELAAGVHALRIETLSPSEYYTNSESATRAPPCIGREPVATKYAD